MVESSLGGLSLGRSGSELHNLELLADNARPLDWNGPTGRAFARLSDEDLERPIVHHVGRAARRYRDRIAVADSNSALTYGTLWDGVAGLAETVAARTKPGDLVAILLPASPMFPLAMLACLAAGRPFVALDPHSPGDWLDQAVAGARAALIIAGGDETPSRAAEVIHLTSAPRPAREGWRPAEFGLDEPACVLFTSGSTGRPKGVVNSERNVLQRAGQSINAAHINSDDKLLTLASPSTIVGVRDIITALVAGASVRLLDPHRASAREILHVIRTDAVSILFAFPALMRSIATFSGERACDTLRLVRMGGDTIVWSDIDLLRAWLAPDAAIQSIYAATEAPIMQWFVDEACRGEDARVPIGFPLPGNRIAVIDTDDRSVRSGKAGELVVASPYVALGLWSDGRCADDAFERCASGRVFRTGDIVRQRPDGLLERLGRKDRQVKIRGVRVELDGVEAALRRHPSVRDVGVLARTTGDTEAVLVAYVNAHDDAPAELLNELRELMGALPQAMRPSRIYRALRIPRLESSKLDVRALAALDDANAEAERTAPGLAAADEMARTVAHVWRKTLDRHVASPTDDFFEAGGDSLKAITFVMELEQALGLELSLTLINEAPQFAQLCEVLRERRTDSQRLVSLKAGEGAPPLYFVHGLGGSVVDLFPVARSLAYPGAVVGVQACGLARGEKPHTSVERMADEYLRAIKARQPEGPYHLCGYSFGGLVAFEMARRFRQVGDEVGLVGLFDTSPGALHWPASVWLELVRRRLARFAAPAVGAWTGMSNFVKRIGEKSKGRDAPRQADGVPSFLKSAPARVLATAATALVASARYRPGFYPGEVKLFIPDERDPALPMPQAIWRGHARSVSVVPVAGDHLTMMSARNAEATARALRRSLPAL